jgi:1-acyl-sn-glycerol-3-phosphate acyltransferase
MALLPLLRTLAGRPPPGMSIADARLAGIVPPAGWTAPRRDRVVDAIRTVVVVGGAIAKMRADLETRRGDSTTAEGLARIREEFAESARLLRVDVRVHHADRVPATGGLVFMWNQTSHLDHLVLPLAIPRPFHTTYNNEVRRFPVYGEYLRRSDHFWIDRTDETQWREQIDRAAARIRGGACVLVSPEGTRSWDGALLPMKRGAFLLARRAECPIVCVIVRGARELLPRGRLAVRPGTVAIELSEPIPVDATTSPDLEARVIRTFEEGYARLKINE